MKKTFVRGIAMLGLCVSIPYIAVFAFYTNNNYTALGQSIYYSFTAENRGGYNYGSAYTKLGTKSGYWVTSQLNLINDDGVTYDRIYDKGYTWSDAENLGGQPYAFEEWVGWKLYSQADPSTEISSGRMYP